MTAQGALWTVVLIGVVVFALVYSGGFQYSVQAAVSPVGVHT